MPALYQEAKLSMQAQEEAAMPQSKKWAHPNHFELNGKRNGKTIKVVYDSDSIAGKPQLTYEYNGSVQTFSGDQITTQDTNFNIGTLVSVLLSKSTTFTILLPRFDRKESTFKTIAITTDAPMEVEQVYHVDELQGTAQEVQYLKTAKDTAKRPLKVVLDLGWAHNDIYHAKVSVTVLDSCYAAGDLHLGLPSGEVGIPEMEYLTLELSHKGEICGQIVRTIDKTIDIKFSSAKPKVTAFAVVNGEVVGKDTKQFPKSK
jgi:hypothetical protein